MSNRRCLDCDELLAPDSHPSRKRCPPCVVKADRAAITRWKRARKSIVSPVKFADCLWCGHVYRQATGHMRYCSPEHYRESIRKRMRGVAQRRRARLLAAVVEVFDPHEIFERDGWVCRLCDEPVLPDQRVPHPLAPTLDHITALANGGDHTRANTQCAHYRCNCRKGARAA